jgi:hypothetical protein
MRGRQTMVASMDGVDCLNTMVIAALAIGRTVYFMGIRAFTMKKIKSERRAGLTMVNTLVLLRKVLPNSNIGTKLTQSKGLSTLCPKSYDFCRETKWYI